MNTGSSLLRRSPLTMLTLLTLVIVSVVIVQGREPVDHRTRSDGFWKYLTFNAVEAEHYNSLEEMARRSDVVVLGRLTGIEESRAFGTNADAEIVHLAQITVEIERVLAGQLEDAGTTALLLEVLLPDPESLPELQKALSPAVPHLLFLRNKGREVKALGGSSEQSDSERRFYRLVSTQGQFRDFDGTTGIPVAAEDDFLFALAGSSFDDVIARVEAATRP